MNELKFTLDKETVDRLNKAFSDMADAIRKIAELLSEAFKSISEDFEEVLYKGSKKLPYKRSLDYHAPVKGSVYRNISKSTRGIRLSCGKYNKRV